DESSACWAPGRSSGRVSMASPLLLGRLDTRIWTPQARGSRGGANRVATSNGQRVYRLSRAPVGVGAPPRSRIPSCKGDFVTGAALGTWRIWTPRSRGSRGGGNRVETSDVQWL